MEEIQRLDSPVATSRDLKQRAASTRRRGSKEFRRDAAISWLRFVPDASGWLKSFIQYSFIPVVAIAFLMIFEQFVFRYVTTLPPTITSAEYTIAGVPKEAFSQFPMPRNTEVFEPTFKGLAVVRSGDITKDPRYGHNPPHHGMPRGHLPVKSYLAVPVKGRSGTVIGGLFFGHPEPDRFTEAHERLAVGISSWASVALENARMYAAAQEASRLKDDFLASLSHELRTPLNAILGYARMLRTGILGPERHDKGIETIERNATSLTQMVEDVLDISRIVSGKIRLNVQPVEFPDIVRNAVDAVTPAADAKAVRVETVLDPQAAPVSGDPEPLQQILWNLLSMR